MVSIAFLVSYKLYLAATANLVEPPHTFINYTRTTIDSIRFDGVGGLSGGGATSTFLFAYEPSVRAKILDWMFKPDFAGSLDILKVEIGSDDQTTDGCEGCHMRSPNELNCSRGYEWSLMKEAVKRNPNITLYGLPWGFAGWLGFGTQNPYFNVNATADYVAKWVECGRDVHGLNISVLGLWNEAWQAAGRPRTDPWDYAIALRERLDSSGLQHVRILAPDGDIASMVQPMRSNASYRRVVWGLGQHYPGGRGTTQDERGLGLPLWSSEDYSTYSDATGAGCWARLLVQNAGWGYGATISWYLISAFARGMDYDGDGLLRAEWPTSGHWEVTPMLWMTMHWTLFTDPGWRILSCITPQCRLEGGGSYAVLQGNGHTSIIVETFLHSASKCIRCDPPDWEVAPNQTVTISLPGNEMEASTTLQLWRSCTSWRYPADDDAYLMRVGDVVSVNSTVTFSAAVNCYYTLTTVLNRTKPALPQSSPSTKFPLPYFEHFEGTTVGAEAPYFGDQSGKWETVRAGGARGGLASQQQLSLAPWPILEPQCNDHAQPISIIGDIFFEHTRVAADLLVEREGVGAGLALRVRNQKFFRGVTPGVYLYVGAVPAAVQSGARSNPGGVAPGPNTPLQGWALCADSFCHTRLREGTMPSSSPPVVGHWHSVSLEVTLGRARGSIDNETIFADVVVGPSSEDVDVCVKNTRVVTDKVIAGFDYKQLPLNSSSACARACCEAPECQAWAVAKGLCWLKDGWAFQNRTGEDSCAVKPSVANVPPSGWAAIVATLGKSQVDNFALEGTGEGGAPVAPCKDGDGLGAALSSAPCDYPGAVTRWILSTSGTMQLIRQPITDERAPPLCLGLTHDAKVNLVLCESASVAKFRDTTGQIIFPNARLPSELIGDGDLCVEAVQREETSSSLPMLAVKPCAKPESLPNDAQQFQFNPLTGALRPKGSYCVSTFANSVLNYRDCCLALCLTT